MYRAILSFVLLIPSSNKNYPREKITPRVKIQSEFRYDNIDNDETEKRLSREKINFFLSKKSKFNFSHIYIDEKNEHRMTWNLNLFDISPKAGFIIGNYNINFGSGLLIGKKNLFSPDIYSSRLIASHKKSFSPCNSGNPLFCFNGIALNSAITYSNFLFSLNAFYSLNSRYALSEIYESYCIKSSFSSINSRLDTDYKYSEPVTLNAYGLMLKLERGKNYTFGIYFFYSDIKNDQNNNILWKCKEMQNYSESIKSIHGYGIFSQYSDDYINIFIEFGIPMKKIVTNSISSRYIYDYGLLYGMEFKHPFFSISFKGKSTGKNFYSPYCSGNSYAETKWIIKSIIKPIKKLSFGTSFSSEKKLSPGYTEPFLPLTIKEELFLYFKFSKRNSIKIKYKRLEREKDLKIMRDNQIKSIVDFTPKDNLKLRISGLMQKNNSKPSYSLSTGLSYMFLAHFKFIIYYAGFHISKDNNIYMSTAKFSRSLSGGLSIKKTSNVIISMLAFNYKKNSFSVKYLHQFLINRSIKKRIELYGILFF